MRAVISSSWVTSFTSMSIWMSGIGRATQQAVGGAVRDVDARILVEAQEGAQRLQHADHLEPLVVHPDEAAFRMVTQVQVLDHARAHHRHPAVREVIAGREVTALTG